MYCNLSLDQPVYFRGIDRSFSDRVIVGGISISGHSQKTDDAHVEYVAFIGGQVWHCQENPGNDTISGTNTLKQNSLIGGSHRSQCSPGWGSTAQNPWGQPSDIRNYNGTLRKMASPLDL